MHHYEQDVPFEVPQGWVWCKLDDLAFYKKGPFGSSLTKSMFVLKGDNTYKVYEQKNAIQKNEKLGTYYISKEKYQELIAFAIQPFDIIVSCAGTIGETFVLPQEPMEGIINQALMLVRLYNRDIEKFYLLYFDYILKEEAYKESKGTAIKNIPPFDVLKNFYIPLPPFSEQQRIVAEIERWFALIDTIEQGKVELQTAIKQTKSKILDLAIHGKLVPQDPNDEPAIELVRRINPKAQITCDNGHSRKLPQSWTWVKGKNIFAPMKSTKPTNEKFQYIDIDSIDNKRQIISEVKTIKTVNAPSRANRYTQKNDVVFSMVRPYLRNIAKVTNDNCIASTGFYVCSSIPQILHPDYCYYLMISDNVVNGLNQFMKGDNSPSINKGHIDEWLFPLPPLAEQQRIVQKIEKMFFILDDIQNALEV
ncbi:restriction endonuclease subunit S [Hoylesella marshii]|uniref:Type I restriction modification DNA specificity domain protein n=1 Tax=Hoylesella marshii DSM 16973 = JCM 13450 TaxID=862515 RepID=E0NSH1_9BACT|nr:restriction endonuclease subunit S [Hoylesella marshii]EFM01923.1 type I restriction modification DNA specificity domain protein [Hoylesella marshii DSM 16973 = JCM 13450]